MISPSSTNVPRRYASFVYQHGLTGLEELSEEAKAFLPPSGALTSPCRDTTPCWPWAAHGGETLPMAQASKTLHGPFHPVKLARAPFVHFNGAYHSQDGEGIGWYLREGQPDLDILTIHVHMQSDMFAPDESEVGRGDFLLVTHERMTRTH